MDKPISIVLKESKERVIDCINNLGLKPSILELIVGEVYNEVKVVSQNELNADIKAYNAELLAEQEEDIQDEDIN